MSYEQRLDIEQHQSLIARLSARFYEIVHVYPVDPIEFIGSVEAAAYGLMLLSPLQTFRGTRSFDAVQRYVSEFGAGVLFAFVGLLWLAGVFMERRSLRLVSSLCAAFLFTLWAIMIAQSNIDGGGWLTYGVFAATSMWAFWRQCSRG